MTQYINFINETVPGMNSSFLEKHYGFLNQAGNSAVHQHDKDGKETPS